MRYRYDALGRRVQRYFVGGKENTKFIYDGNDVLVDDNNGTLTKYQNGLGTDSKLKMVTNGQASYFLTDHLGSTNALTDSSGNIDSDTLTILINLDHPLIKNAVKTGGIEDLNFRRLAYEIAFSEYAIILGNKMVDNDPDMPADDLLFEVRSILHRISTKSASVLG